MNKKCIHETIGKKGKECACLTKMLCKTGECSFCRPEGEYLFNRDKSEDGRIVGVEAINKEHTYRAPLKNKKADNSKAKMEEWAEKYKDDAEFKAFFVEEWPKTCAMVKEALAATRA